MFDKGIPIGYNFFLKMIVIVDYGRGNLRSVQKGFEKIGYEAVITSNPAMVESAHKIVLPGVGAFRDAMQKLETLGLKDAIISSIESGKPYLGICLGLHLLFSLSEEFGLYKGFNILKGRVRKFQHNLKIPHMGWNQVRFRIKEFKFHEAVGDNKYFYFVHSYYVEPEDESVIAATTRYGVEFPSIIWKGNIYATQFHPEKSQKAGLSLLKAFGEV
jgi:glutamine amidotransferase